MLFMKLRFGFLNAQALGHIWANITYFDFLDCKSPLILIVKRGAICNNNAFQILRESLCDYPVLFCVVENHCLLRILLKSVRILSNFFPFIVYENTYFAHHCSACLRYGSPYKFYKKMQTFVFLIRRHFSQEDRSSINSLMNLELISESTR